MNVFAYVEHVNLAVHKPIIVSLSGFVYYAVAATAAVVVFDSVISSITVVD